MSWLDAGVWSGAWLAAAAVALVAASSRAMGLAPAPLPMLLAATGTLAIYANDRLRDRVRDRATAPERAAFVDRHRVGITALALASGLVAAASALASGPRVAALAAGVALLGLFHRRLKRWAAAKPVYLTCAWTAVAVGVPALHRSGAAGTWTAGVVAPTILANVALSNLRDGEGLAGVLGHARTLRTVAAILALGAAVALLGPPGVRPLVALPAAMAAALAGYRPGERYGALAVDGALLAGALVALAGSGA